MTSSRSQRPDTLVVIPAYNEAPRIGRVLSKLPAWIASAIVVDDASTDDTPLVARASGDPRIHVLTHSKNLGVGAAILTGYRKAIALGDEREDAKDRDAIVVMAGDDQMDPRDLEALVAPIHAGSADYAKGNRFAHLEAWSSIPIQRRLGGEVFSGLTSIVAGQRFHDTQCGYTALSRGACREVLEWNVWPGFGYPNDLLLKLAEHKKRICEITVRPVYADEESKLRIQHLGAIFSIIARAALRKARANADT